MYQHIDIGEENNIVTITLNRPEKLNAFVGHMRRDLAEALEEAGSDHNVRVVVITGAGRAFCAGSDVGFLAELIERRDTEEFSRLLGSDASGEVRTFVRSAIERTTPEADIFAVTAMRDRNDQTARLSGLQCRTMVVAGSGDAILKVEDCREMANAIPRGEFVVIPNTGHLSNLEDPAAFNRTVDDFLRRSDSK